MSLGTTMPEGGRLPLAPPGGMRDLLQPESAAREELGRRLVETFGLWGYQRVTTPPFEHAEVLERGLDQVDRRDLLRFVEPETGEVALLRPDITPQIARIVATRLRDRPSPWRLCYEGTVIRRRRGRARRQQQLAQAGIECIGLQSADADAEVVHVASRACESVGLNTYRIELHHVRIGRAALEAVPTSHREVAAEALEHKDVGALERVLREAGVRAPDRRRLLKLPDLYGGTEVLRDARRQFRGEPAREALAELEEIVERLDALGLTDRLDVDLGELRGQAYYTGVSFDLLAEGPGESVGAGGRYDNLLGRFGLPAPATGFALDIGNLEWALARTEHPVMTPRPTRLGLADPAPPEAARLAEALRARNAAVADLSGKNRQQAVAFAAAWDYDGVLVKGRTGVRAVRARDGAVRDLDPESADALDALVQWLR